MIKIVGAIVSFFKGIISVFHIDKALDDSTIQLVIKVGVAEALLAHPEAKMPIVEVSQKVIDGIDGKILNAAPDVMGLLKDELAKAGLDAPIQILIDGLMTTYAAQLIAWFDKNAVNDELAKLTEIRKLAVLVNNAAGGKAV